MARPTPPCPHEHDRVRLPTSPSPQGSGSEKKKPEPAAAADPACHQAGNPDPTQPAAAANMLALPQTLATNDPQKSAKVVLVRESTMRPMLSMAMRPLTPITQSNRQAEGVLS